ncbi:CGNR zinc finger domain-containing protein [Georgenia ruanii]|uniref:RNA-binding protein n=1 Tax=Georgenia ruanii TaxID=348442 RepID=A0A7J9UV44_9MICO|nr:CGNR zinc finger domain-containing protein [Georgenia ruanii]MPV87700.1 RNA-binding protein [Georgenia ruanii]
MVFSRDTEIGLVTAAALVNTLGAEEDRLSTLADLDAFVTHWEFTGALRRDDAELQGVRALRPVLRGLWAARDPDVVAAGVNALLTDARALPQLVRHDGWDWHWHATPHDAPLATRMAVEAAMALADVVRGGELDRLRVCAGEDCADLVVDLSRNRSRRYCDSGCGNRANVAAYRARKAAS